MLVATLFLLALGLAAAVLLAVASKVFHVEEDPKLLEVEDALLGANCGGCGYPGCSSAAEAVLAGKAGADICVAGGMSIATKVAEVMGLEIEVKEPQKACTSCTYGTDRAATRFTYMGINDCAAAILYGNGPKVCTVGCMGLGSCVRACPFGALSMGPEGLPVVDQRKCRACGICVEICPKGIMELSSHSDRMLGDFRENQCTTPCQRECPTGIDIPLYIKRIAEGDDREAIRVIKERNPLPMICGRVCPAPCELNCRRNLVDEAVAINPLKRFASEQERALGEHVLPFRNPDTNRRIAVVGGGAQGLTTAYYTACMGHAPTIFEASPVLGGILRKVIPQSRLSDGEFDWELEGIMAAGVKAEVGKVLGTDVSVTGLLGDGYELVVLATGGVDSRRIMRPGSGAAPMIPGVRLLVDFLASSEADKLPPMGDAVIIVGAGRSTLSAAERCLDAGIRSVTVVSPYSREDLTNRGIDVAPLEGRGVTFLFDACVTGLRGAEDTLTGVTVAMAAGEDTDLSASTVIAATGRLSDLAVRGHYSEGDEPALMGWETLPVFRTLSAPGQGDLFGTRNDGVLNDNVAVVRSIGRGRRLARAVHLSLTGKEIAPEADALRRDSKVQDVEEVHDVANSVRQRPDETNRMENFCNAEVLFDDQVIEGCFDVSQARTEAARCLECGLVCYRHDEEVN